MILKKLKKIGGLALALAILIAPLSANAYNNTLNDNSVVENSDLENLKSQLKEVGEKYGFEVELDDTSKLNTCELNFDTIEEFERFLKESSETADDSQIHSYNLMDELGNEHILNQEELKALLNSQNIKYTVTSDGNLSFNYDELDVQSSFFKTNKDIESKAVTTTGTSSHTFRQDSEQFTLFYKRVMSMKYDWKRVPVGSKPGTRQCTRVYGRKAYPEGFYVGDFTPTKYWHQFTNSNHTVTNKVTGTWKLSASIAGLPVNYTKTQTWTFTLSIA